MGLSVDIDGVAVGTALLTAAALLLIVYRAFWSRRPRRWRDALAALPLLLGREGSDAERIRQTLREDDPSARPHDGAESSRANRDSSIDNRLKSRRCR